MKVLSLNFITVSVNQRLYNFSASNSDGLHCVFIKTKKKWKEPVARPFHFCWNSNSET